MSIIIPMIIVPQLSDSTEKNNKMKEVLNLINDRDRNNNIITYITIYTIILIIRFKTDK